MIGHHRARGRSVLVSAISLPCPIGRPRPSATQSGGTSPFSEHRLNTRTARLMPAPPHRTDRSRLPPREAAGTGTLIAPSSPLPPRPVPPARLPLPGPVRSRSRPHARRRSPGCGVRARPPRPLRPRGQPERHGRAGLARRGPADPHRRGRRGGHPPRPARPGRPCRPGPVSPSPRRCGTAAGCSPETRSCSPQSPPRTP